MKGLSTNNITQKDLDQYLNDIESLQKEEENILYNKNWFYVFWNLGKATRIHRKAHKMLLALAMGYLLEE